MLAQTDYIIYVLLPPLLGEAIKIRRVSDTTSSLPYGISSRDQIKDLDFHLSGGLIYHDVERCCVIFPLLAILPFASSMAPQKGELSALAD